mgnify:CR=1 FL=1
MSTIEKKGVITLKSQKMVVGLILALSAVNWGLVGLLNLNLVDAVFGAISPTLSKVVYILIGLVGVYKLYHITMGKGKAK